MHATAGSPARGRVDSAVASLSIAPSIANRAPLRVREARGEQLSERQCRACRAQVRPNERRDVAKPRQLGAPTALPVAPATSRSAPNRTPHDIIAFERSACRAAERRRRADCRLWEGRASRPRVACRSCIREDPELARAAVLGTQVSTQSERGCDKLLDESVVELRAVVGERAGLLLSVWCARRRKGSRLEHAAGTCSTRLRSSTLLPLAGTPLAGAPSKSHL